MASASSAIRILGLPRQKLAALRAQAKASGMTPHAYAKHLVEEGLELDYVARTTSFDVLCERVRKNFEESGMTEDELDTLVNAARRRYHRRISGKPHRRN